MGKLSRALLAAMSLAGLAGGSACSADKERLTGACQVQRCVCGPAGWSAAAAGGEVPVVWRSDGTASCPPDLELHLLQPPPGRIGG